MGKRQRSGASGADSKLPVTYLDELLWSPERQLRHLAGANVYLRRLSVVVAFGSPGDVVAEAEGRVFSAFLAPIASERPLQSSLQGTCSRFGACGDHFGAHTAVAPILPWGIGG